MGSAHIRVHDMHFYCSRVTSYFKMTKKIPTYKLALAILDFSKVDIKAHNMVFPIYLKNSDGLL